MSGEEAKVWIDASSVALGVAVEVGRCVVEDASWLCKDDSCHINMAELDAAIKGLNLVMAWRMQRVELLTDSNSSSLDLRWPLREEQTEDEGGQ